MDLTTTILLTIFILISLAQLIHGIMAHNKLKKIKIREDFKHAELLEAWLKLEIAIKQLNIDAVEFESLKRWMRANMDQLQEHSDKMEELFGAMQPDQGEQPLDLDNYMEDDKDAVFNNKK